MRSVVFVGILLNSIMIGSWARAGYFAPAAGQPGSTAIAAQSPSFVGWATGTRDLTRGPLDIANPTSGNASFGTESAVLGISDGRVVSLGDGGSIVLTFANAITDRAGYDFAVFENGFLDTFLELAFVEVSSNGTDFFRFEATSLTPTDTQVGGFGALDPTNLNNLAGKYRAGFGTPFDLAELAGVSPLLDIHRVSFVRIVDVVGSIDPRYGTRDAGGRLINDPYRTPFASGGFDLDAVGVIHAVPEPGASILLGLGVWLTITARRMRWSRLSRAG